MAEGVGFERLLEVFFNFHYSATTTSLPEANSLITNERQ